MSEKINFAWVVTSDHANVYKQVLALVDKNIQLLEDKRLVVFGAGIRGCILLGILEKRGYKNIVFCDNNTQKQGHLINSYDILSLEEALKYTENQIFLIAPEDSESMRNQLRDAKLSENLDWISFDISVYDAYVCEYVRDAKEYALVMGDCAFTHASIVDENADSLGDMIKQRIKTKDCSMLAVHGLGQQAHYHVVKTILESKDKENPLLLLLLVMEALTPKAHLMPRTQHPTLLKKVIKATPSPSPDFEDYAKLAQERFDKFQVESFATSSSQEQSEKLFMKMNYLFKIKENTEGVVYLKKTIKLLNDANIPVVLYIPPVNYMQGEKFFGESFNAQYSENFTKLYEMLDKENLKYKVADASFLLTKDEFAATNTIDETANYKGRSKIVQFLSEHKELSDYFR